MVTLKYSIDINIKHTYNGHYSSNEMTNRQTQKYRLIIKNNHL